MPGVIFLPENPCSSQEHWRIFQVADCPAFTMTLYRSYPMATIVMMEQVPKIPPRHP